MSRIKKVKKVIEAAKKVAAPTRSMKHIFALQKALADLESNA